MKRDREVQISFAKDVKALVSVMEEMGDPFLEESTSNR